MSDGDAVTPLFLTWRHRPGAVDQDWRKCLPEVHLTIGRDALSAGLTITAWTDTGGQHPHPSVLWTRRWKDPVMSTQEALEIAYRGIAAALVELFGVDVS